jgi:hypothetical protein
MCRASLCSALRSEGRGEHGQQAVDHPGKAGLDDVPLTRSRRSPCRPWSAQERVVAQCEVCGNNYDMAFEVHAQGAVHVFDSFECAIHRMAPVCEHCGCKVIGQSRLAARSSAARTARTPPVSPACRTACSRLTTATEPARRDAAPPHAMRTPRRGLRAPRPCARAHPRRGATDEQPFTRRLLAAVCGLGQQQRLSRVSLNFGDGP